MRRLLVFFIVFLSSGCLPAATVPGIHLDMIEMPEGFAISLFACVPGARSMTLGGAGTVFVGTRRGGKVYAVTDRDRDGRADEVTTVARGLDTPNGVAFRGGALYVAEVSRILRFDDIEQRLADPPAPVVISDDLPRDEHHGWKFVAFGPDGKLYVPLGAPCNVCEGKDERHASILRLDPADGKMEIFARGVRNTVGFDWHPQSGVLWFTENGRDWMGDDQPPDELNRAPQAGMHFGFPYCHGNGIPDPEFGAGKACKDYTAPAIALGPHVAALGMRFYTGSRFPPPYRGRIFIAEHGSWNRKDPIGYRISMVRVEDGRALDYEVFARGWLQEGGAWGRPVDVLEMPDGALLVSDDRAGAIYRIAYAGE
jgi:glucose/arabinose dehydrogenase